MTLIACVNFYEENIIIMASLRMYEGLLLAALLVCCSVTTPTLARPLVDRALTETGSEVSVISN